MAKQDYSNSARLLSTGFGNERSHGLFCAVADRATPKKIWNSVDRPCLGFNQAFLRCWANMLATIVLVYYSASLVALSLFACHLGVGSCICMQQ